MTILFLGNFEAEFSSENYYLRTLTRMGHTVLPMQEGKAHADMLRKAVNTNKVDLFFWVHTHGWRTIGIGQFLDECRILGIKSFAYHLDLYLGIRREIQFETDPFFTVDHFFTVDLLMAEKMNERNNGTTGHFLPAGVYEEECFIGTPNREKYPHDIIFTGSKGYHPEWPYRPQLIDWLHRTYGSRFGHYGGGGKPSVRGPELNNLYASAKIVVGDTLCKNFDYPYYSSDRLFEVAGRGGFQIYPEIKGLEDFYTEEEIMFYDFNDFDQLKRLIDYFLGEENAPEREAMQTNSFNRTKAEHTYRHRLTTILNILSND